MRSSLRGRHVAICAGTIALTLARAGPLKSQATQVQVCYAPLVGLIYLIKEPGLAQSCLSIGGVQHVALSWDKTGPNGDKGPPGVAGTEGVAGADGPPGDKGPTGAAGAPGDVGDKGATGDKGPPGGAGATGDKGAVGDKGPTGEQGAIGDKGPVGDKGPNGQTGPVGDKGPSGDPGPAGDKGPTGDKGPVGDKGETGDKGIVGEKGIVGDKGPIGEKGPVGDQGPQGPAGPDGGPPCNVCVTTPMIANLAVTNAKLAPIDAPGKVRNSATSATPFPLGNQIAQRDAAGSFETGGVTSASGVDLSTRLSMAATSSILAQGGAHLWLGPTQSAENANIYVGPGAGTNGHIAEAPNVRHDVGVGFSANNQTTGAASAAVGVQALDEGSSFASVAVGAFAVDNGPAPGNFNTVVGWQAGRDMSANGSLTPTRNILIGERSGGNLTTHSHVIALKRGNITGANTTFIGGIAGATEGLQTRAFIAGIQTAPVTGLPLLINSSFQLGVAASSQRFKTDVRDLGSTSAALYRLRPVSYRYRADVDASSGAQYGLIAEEVDRTAPEVVARDSAGVPYTVRYEMLVPLLVNEIQRRRAQLTLLQQQSRVIERRLEQLESMKP